MIAQEKLKEYKVDLARMAWQDIQKYILDNC